MAGTEDDFVNKFEEQRSDDGYGLVMSKGSAERRDMAEAFDAPEDDGDDEPAPMSLDDGAEVVEATSPGADAGPGVETTPVYLASAAPVDLPAFENESAAPAPAAPAKAAEPAATAGSSMDSQSFGQAFKHFRGKGVKEFAWRGKRYSTALKSEAKPTAKEAPAAKAQKALTQDQETAAEVFDEEAPRRKESTNGFGPNLNPKMRPKPDARGIYEGAAIGPHSRKELAAKLDRAANAQVSPMTVTDKDGTSRPAQSVAELMAARKASGG